MARVRIFRARAEAYSIELGTKLITQVMYEIHFRASIQARGGPYSTGNLATSLYRRGPFVVGPRITGKVGSSLSYARAVHDGAGVHSIFPKAAPHVFRFGRRTGRPKLKFYWRRAGKVVYLPQIPGSPRTVGHSHPGQKGKHYLTEPLIAVAAKHNMEVIVYDL